jgi:hypothetical protein
VGSFVAASAGARYTGQRLGAATQGGAGVATDELARLAPAIERQTTTDGAYDTTVAALRLSRFSAPSELVALVYEPYRCVVARGARVEA